MYGMVLCIEEKCKKIKNEIKEIMDEYQPLDEQ